METSLAKRDQEIGLRSEVNNLEKMSTHSSFKKLNGPCNISKETNNKFVRVVMSLKQSMMQSY